MTVTFKAGLVSLAAYGLTSGGYEWGAQNKDLGNGMPPGFQTDMGEKCQLLLSDKLMGFFLVPESGVWNYSFLGANFSTKVEKAYHVKIDTPVGYYTDIYRPLHFQNFAELEDMWVDRSDNLE